MKNIFRLGGFIIILLFTIFAIISCKGDAGFTGPAGAPGADSDQVVFLQNGVGSYTGCKDTMALYDNYINPDFTYQNVTYSTSSTLEVGSVYGTGGRAFIKFNLTGTLPETAKVTGAVLSLMAVSFVGKSNTISAYAVTSQWDPDYVTWAHSYVTQFNLIDWTNPGGDYNSLKISGDNIPVYEYNKLCTWNIDPALVQQWVDHPDKNYGLMLAGAGENSLNDAYNMVIFSSSEYTDISMRPKLAVYYTSK
jgi:hypothetical protein